MAHRFTAFISAVLFVACALTAVAQVPDIWSAAGVTGIVDEAGLNIHQFNSSGSVSIKSTVANARLEIRFPMQTLPSHEAPAGACTEMRAMLRDTGPGTRIIVRLMRLGIGGGFDGQLTSLGGIDTNSSKRWSRLNEPLAYGQYRSCLNVPAGSPFDFAFFTYYVEAQLFKTAEGGNPGPGLMAVQICHTTEQCEP